MPVGDDPIEALLGGRYPDPETGEQLRAESRSVVIEDSLAGREVQLVSSLGLGRHLAMISDANTFAALGERVERALSGSYTIQRIVLDGAFDADVETIARLAAVIEPRTDAVVTVGSGTLNDLSKMVALESGCPQVVFATAPSMNGYTSLSASITGGGVKRSVRAATPVGVFFDLGVLAKAPLPLIRAGLGDSSCRPTAQADWLLSHLLLDRPYREVPFTLLAADSTLRIPTDKSARVHHGEAELIGPDGDHLSARSDSSWTTNLGCFTADFGLEIATDTQEISAAGHDVHVCEANCPDAGEGLIAWGAGSTLAWRYTGKGQLVVRGPKGRVFDVTRACADK